MDPAITQRMKLLLLTAMLVLGPGVFAQEPSGEELALSPQFADVFGNSDRGISIRFSRGQNGVVTGFVLNTSRMKGVVFRKT